MKKKEPKYIVVVDYYNSDGEECVEEFVFFNRDTAKNLYKVMANPFDPYIINVEYKELDK